MNIVNLYLTGSDGEVKSGYDVDEQKREKDEGRERERKNDGESVRQ